MQPRTSSPSATEREFLVHGYMQNFWSSALARAPGGDGDLIDLDPALREDLFDIAMGEPERNTSGREDDDVGSEARDRRIAGGEQGEGGEFSWRQPCCSKAIMANATARGR